MDERRYLVEVLLKARESISQVAQKAAKSLDELGKSQNRLNEQGKKAAEVAQKQRQTLEQLHESHIREKRDLDDQIDKKRKSIKASEDLAVAHRAQAKAIRDSTAALKQDRDEARARQAGYLSEAAALAELASAREDQIGKIDKSVASLRNQAEAARKMADTNRRLAASFNQSINAIERDARAHDDNAESSERDMRAAERTVRSRENASIRAERSIANLERRMLSFDSRQQKAAGQSTVLTRALTRMGFSATGAQRGLGGLNSELRGLAVAAVIKYAQSLISALVALGAELFAVAAAAGQAAIGIGAALGAGMAQAIPVVGVLAAAFGRLAAILKVVKLQNDQQLTATHNAAAASRAQASAAEAIRSAEERVADAHRNTASAVEDLAQTRADAARQEVQAQRDVNQARKDAIRTVEDLMAAEQQAQQTAEQAQASLRNAVRSGDVAGVAQARLDVGQANRGVTRAREDAAPVRARGVQGVDAVIQAEQRLADIRRTNDQQVADASRRIADARRQEARATEDLARTRTTAADNLTQETAAADKLTDSLNRLSPAERTLYGRILALQAVYRRASRPITDIIAGAFTDVVDRTIGALRDPRILSGFRNIAIQVARSIRAVTGEAGGERSVGAFEILSAEATRNIPIVTRILLNFFRAVRAIVLQALPAFRLLLDYVEGYSERARDAAENSTGLADFFVTGVKYAKSFFDLILAVIGLLLALAGPGGASAEGIRTIDELTDRVEGLTRKARRNADSIRDFFGKVHDAFFAIVSVIGTLASTMVEVFNARSVQTFADFLNMVIIPAIGDVVQIMGVLVTAFHALFTLPGVADAAQLAVVFLLLGKGLTVIRLAVLDILEILPTFARAFGLMIPAVEGAATGFAALTPIGWVALAIAAITAAVILLNKHFHFLGPTLDWIKAAMADAWDWIKAAAEDVVDWFEDVWNQGLLKWLRWPFEHIQIPLFKWLINAALDVISFFQDKFGPGGSWEEIGHVITLPFRVTRRAVGLILDYMGTAVQVFLDIIAGRFGDAGDTLRDFFTGLVDTMAGAFTSFLDLIEKVLRALGNVPKIGGPFRDAADAVAGARDGLNDWRDNLDDANQKQEEGNDVVDKAIPRIAKLRERYDDARDALKKLKPGTDEYKEAVKTSRRAQHDYNDEIRKTASRAGGARRPVRTLKDNIKEMGDVSSDTAEAVATDLNAVLEEVGAKKINVRIRRARRRSSAQNLLDTDNPLLDSPFPAARYMGGMASPYGGSSRDDHLLLDPSGRAVAAMSGTEGVVNAPQMGVINQALSFAQQFAGMPWGSLGELWGSGMRHFQAGGQMGQWNPVRLASAIRARGPYQLGENARLGDPPRAGVHSATGWHYRLGNSGAIDINADGAPGGEAVWLDRLSRWLRRLGYHVLWRVAGHFDHLHVDAATGGATPGAGRVRTPRVVGGGDSVIGRVARAGARRLTRAANRYIDQQTLAMGDTGAPAMGADANVVAAFRRAIRRTGANRTERLALWEAGLVESGLRNLHYGDRDSLGSLQERTSIYGRGHALNPFASASRFLTQARALRPWRGSAGSLAQAVQRSAFPSRYDAMAGRARRYLQTGGLLQPTRAAQAAVGPVLGAASRAGGAALKLQRAFTRLTEEDGLLDQLADTVEAIAARGALALQRLQYRITRGGPRRNYQTPAQLAQANVGIQRATGQGLQREGATLDEALGTAQEQLAIAQARGNKGAIAIARAAIVNLRARIEKNNVAIAQNAQDQVEAQESFQQALMDAANDRASRQQASLDRWSRVATAMGVAIDPNQLLDAQVTNMRTQIGDLQGVLAQATRTGNVDLANNVREQIAELDTQIAEAAAQRFQNAIDAVNNEAQRQTTRLDRQARRAQIGGRTDFAAMQNVLTGRRDVTANQIAGLSALAAQALAAGNTTQYDSLIDQIDELDVTLAENTQAIQDNTNAAFADQTQRINDAFGFTSGVFGGVQGFFQALAETTGLDTLPQQLSAMRGIAVALGVQQQGLVGQLGSLIGQDLTGLTGADLIGYLLSITSGPAFDAIMARLDPTQQQAFRDLVTALIGNATAIEQNTKAIGDLTGTNGQSFTSPFWTAFRTAVFNGAGALLPQYQMTIPTAAIGARVLNSGALMVHSGETVRPATVSRDWGEGGGDTYNLNVTTPTEVLNPTDVGRQLSFHRRTSGR